MTTAAIKQQLYNYLEVADSKKLKYPLTFIMPKKRTRMTRIILICTDFLRNKN